VPTGPASKITRADVERAAHGRRREPQSQAGGEASRPRVTPRARKRAAELGIDLATITPRQADAAITAADLPSAAAPRPAVTAAPTAKQTGLSAAVGRLMERSKREIPHYYVSDDIDMSTALQWLERTNASRPVNTRLLPAALMLRAVAIAAQEVREMNGHFIDGVFTASDAVHLGVAVSLRNGGLIAPVIRDAQSLDLASLMTALREVVDRTRKGTLRSSDVDAATVTVTNLGDRGAGAVFGVIIPPQVAIVGFGRISERPWALGGMIGARSIVTASLSADHRVSHGHTGARFLGAVARCLSNPEDL
jgi:pyruvate dehydrogenase E2 component (dihydrolipoamide acetyltransferase)